MNIWKHRLLGGMTALALPVSAMGATVTSNMPLGVDNNPVAGVNTIVSITVDETAIPANDLNNGDVARVFVDVVAIAADGTTVRTINAGVDVTAGAGGTVLAAPGVTDIEVDLSGFATTLNLSANAAMPGETLGLVFYVDDQAGDPRATGIVQGGNFTNGAPTATTDGLVFDNDPVSILNAFLDSTNRALFLVLSRSVNAGDAGAAPAGNDSNQTTPAQAGALVNGDIEIDDNAMFSTPAAVDGGAIAGSILAGSNGTIIQIDYAMDNTNIGINQFVRVGAANATGDAITDILGNQVNNNQMPADNERGDADGTQISALSALTIVSVEAIAEVTAALGAVPNAVRVTYNLPIDPTDLGDFGGGNFYGQFLQLNGTDSSIEITGAAADPDNPNAVLLTVTQTGADLILADGLSGDTSNNQYSISTDTTGDVPSSLFTPDDYMTAQTGLVLSDGIAAAAVFFCFLDTNADGVLDAVAVVFNEPVTSTVGNAGFMINIAAGQTLQPAALLDAVTGEFPAMLPTSQAGMITPTTLTNGDVRIVNNAADDVARLSTGNAFILAYDPTLPDYSGAGAGMDAPGTNGPAGLFTLDHPAFDVMDAGGNMTSVAAGVGVAVTRDRAASLLGLATYFTGDNQGAATNDQSFTEQDGNVGDSRGGGAGGGGDRAFLAFTENTGANLITGNSVIFGNGAEDDFNEPGDVRIAALAFAQRVTFAKGTANMDFNPGVNITLNALGAGVVDAGGNPPVVNMNLSNNGLLGDGVAPYVPLQDRPSGGTVISAFLVDNDNDGFADQVFIQFTEAIVQADIASDGSDFESFGANMGTITGADTLSGNDDSVVVLSLADGEIAMSSAADFRYLGSSAANLIESVATGNLVTDIDTAFQAEEIEEALFQAFSPDAMIIAGQLLGLDGVSGAPIGTRIFATLAIPSIYKIEATHNNVDFTYDYADRASYGTVAENSLDAFNAILLGLHEQLYLVRNENNEQLFQVIKTNADSDTGGSGILTDTIDVTVNASNLTRITFSGSGESNSDRVSGTATLCWSLLRTSPAGGGTPAGLYTQGFNPFGPIILSQTVISEADGRYELHVSGTGGAFLNSPLAALDLPVIIWAQLPTGERFVLSSLVTSASTNDFDADGTIGDGVIFSPNNLRQEDSGTASNATTINFSLANVGIAVAHNGWTMVPFCRVGGYAPNTRDIPVLPNGVTEANIASGDILAVSAFDQFGFVSEPEAGDDGMWTSADDGGVLFGGLFVDFDCVDHFRFNLTTNGIEVGSGMTSTVGGYATGILNLTGNPILIFQFGAQIPAGAIFAANPITGSIGNATNGWLLVTTTEAASPATGFFTGNPGSDYLIFFNNQGSDAGEGIAVQSLSSVPGDANANNLDELPAKAAVFVHYVN